ncbi:hypothetical protein VDG1235_3938 [Verrucomicrobiia bacterium DG1235]|nr:hypothetical protein VDG1235_3938 [Verrucomicrobiae bacterium DG1235]
MELFEDVRKTNGSLEERIRQTEEVLESEEDFVLFEPHLLSGEFVANPSYLIRKEGRFFILQAAAKAGNEYAHREHKMLVTYYGNVRSEWKELVLGLGYSCGVLRRMYPKLATSSWLILPSSNREIGNRERTLSSDKIEEFLKCPDGSTIDQRRRDSVLRFFEAGEAVSLIQGEVAIAMRALEKMRDRRNSPDPLLRYACRNCEYRTGRTGDGFSQCWGKLAAPSPHLFDLHQLYSLKEGEGLLADRKIEQGDVSLLDISEAELGGPHRARQKLQLKCARSGQEWVDPQLATEMSGLEWPVRFVDFETSQSALPWIQGLRPFELIPFQWSCHSLYEDGTLEHAEFLHSGAEDPRREFIATLRNAIGSDGSLLIYTDYEIQVLDTLRKRFVEVSGVRDVDVMWIDELLCSGRIVDQHDWVMKYYCHPIMGGRTSLKKALPSAWHSSDGLGGDPRFFEYFMRNSDGSILDPYQTLPELEIAGKRMSIREGCGAMKGYRELAIGVGRTGKDAHKALEVLMYEYCKLDTAAQAIIFEHWRMSLGLRSQHGNKKRTERDLCSGTKK